VGLKVSASPVPFQSPGGRLYNDPQATLQANKATFFFRLVGFFSWGCIWSCGTDWGVGEGAREGQYVLSSEGGRGTNLEGPHIALATADGCTS
jgi:hypothetical protein